MWTIVHMLEPLEIVELHEAIAFTHLNDQGYGPRPKLVPKDHLVMRLVNSDQSG